MGALQQSLWSKGCPFSPMIPPSSELAFQTRFHSYKGCRATFKGSSVSDSPTVSVSVAIRELQGSQQ